MWVPAESVNDVSSFSATSALSGLGEQHLILDVCGRLLYDDSSEPALRNI